MKKVEEKEKREAGAVKPEGSTTPIVALMSCVSNDLEALITAVQRQYNLPYGLLDLALASVVGKIKDRAIAELSKDYISGRGNEDNEKAEDTAEIVQSKESETDGGYQQRDTSL